MDEWRGREYWPSEGESVGYRSGGEGDRAGVSPRICCKLWFPEIPIWLIEWELTVFRRFSPAPRFHSTVHVSFGVVPEALSIQATISLTTWPATSVRRNRRPWKRYVSFSWSIPSRYRMVA